MLNVCVNCTTWNPDHFLDVGEFTHALGIGYDWLYPELSDDDKATIINATSVFGFQAGLEVVNMTFLPLTHVKGLQDSCLVGNHTC